MRLPRAAALAALLVVGGCRAPRSATTPAPARAPERAPERAPDRVWLDGTSNIRRFTCRSDSARVSLAIPGADSAAATGTLALPVATLDCGIRAQSVHLHEALKANSAPGIEFRLASHRRGHPAAGSTVVPVELRGALRIAGVERPVTIAATLHFDVALRPERAAAGG